MEGVGGCSGVGGKEQHTATGIICWGRWVGKGAKSWNSLAFKT